MRRSSTVFTWTKSTARMPWASVVRNCFQAGLRGGGARDRSRWRAGSARPWRQRRVAEFDEFALHSPVPGGLSVAMRITSFLITAAVDGRPGRRRFAQSHLRVTSRRYQASSAAAVTANTSPRRCRWISRDAPRATAGQPAGSEPGRSRGTAPRSHAGAQELGILRIPHAEHAASGSRADSGEQVED